MPPNIISKKTKDVSRYSHLFLTENAADAIFTADLKGCITYTNHAGERLLKTPLSASAGTHFRKYVHPASLQKAMQCFMLAKAGKQIREEVDVLDKDGCRVPVEFNASALYQDGKIVGVHAIVRDIRHRRKLETLIRESEKKYRSLFEDATDALMITDLKGIILDVNRHAEMLLKADKIHLVGRHHSELYPPQQRGAYNNVFRFSLAGKSQPQDLEVVRSDRQYIPVSVFGRRIMTGEREVILMRFTDLSDRLTREEKLRETNKMMALSLFVSGTAQEIKHPLQAVLNHLEQVSAKYQNRDFEYIGFKEFTDIMTTIKNVGNRLRYCCDITDKLLVLNRKRAGIKEKDCQVNGVIKGALSALAAQFKSADIKLILKLSPKLSPVAISPLELEQIVVNIASNACQAMPAGGKFIVSTTYAKQEKNIYIEFTDTGMGIARENLPRVFEPFFTTKYVGPGKNSGLGLSIVYSIVKSCKGDVTIKSSLREGTSVKVMLPASPR